MEIHLLPRMQKRQQRNLGSNSDSSTELLYKTRKIIKSLCVEFPHRLKKNGGRGGHKADVKKRKNSFSLPKSLLRKFSEKMVISLTHVNADMLADCKRVRAVYRN